MPFPTAEAGSTQDAGRPVWCKVLDSSREGEYLPAHSVSTGRVDLEAQPTRHSDPRLNRLVQQALQVS